MKLVWSRSSSMAEEFLGGYYLAPGTLPGLKAKVLSLSTQVLIGTSIWYLLIMVIAGLFNRKNSIEAHEAFPG